MNFVAIDFETANSFRGSPCEVSLVKVQDGQIADKLTSFIFQEKFDAFNVMLHGIDRQVVKKAPTFEEFWPKMKDFIGDLPVVAHYAAFDTGVIRDSLQGMVTEKPLTYFCTVVLSRKLYKFPTYSLPWVAQELGIDFEESHRAEADAMACAEIAIQMMAEQGTESLFELAEKLFVRPGEIIQGSWRGCTSRGIAPGMPSSGVLTAKQREFILSQIDEKDLYEDPDFLGKEIVFTGAMESMTRNEANLAVLKAGGIPSGSVGKKTNLLVCGYQDSRALKPGATQSSKLEKAISQQKNGQEIEIIDEVLFVQMLQSPAGIE